MASFKDRIPTFNPYVSQQPVEAMVQVGMMKQQQYDTNLQKIYQSMSNVAGMDIMKDADQAYLKDKMSETSQKLKVYASGDFSQNNLTRGVNNMVNSIANDEAIKTAIQSTARVRSEVAKMNQAQKDGKSSVVNEWALNNQINSWLEGTTAGEAFYGAWTPYKDVDAKLMEIYEALPETDKVSENIHKRDAKGNTLYFTKDGKVSTDPESGGQPQIDDVMLYQEIKGKSSNKIMKAFMTSLDADDIRQLDLNASYHYRNASPETFSGEIKDYGEKLKKSYKDNIKTIAKELTTNPDLSQAAIEKLEMAMNSYQDDLDNNVIDKQVEQQLATINDPAKFEEYKKSVFKSKYLLDKANSLENLSTKTLWKENPKWNAMMKVREYDLRVKKYQLDELYKRKNYELAERKFLAEDAEKNALANPTTIVENMPLENDGDPKTYKDLSEELATYTATPENPVTLSDGTVLEKGSIYKLNEKALSSINLAISGEIKLDVLENLFHDKRYNPSKLDDKDKKIIKTKQFREYYRKRLDLDSEKLRLQSTFVRAAEKTKHFDKEWEDYMNERRGFISTSYNFDRKEAAQFKKDLDSAIVTVPDTQVAAGIPGGGSVSSNSYTYIDYDKLRRKYKDPKFLELIDIHEKNSRNKELTAFESTAIRGFNTTIDDIEKTKSSIFSRQKAARDLYVKQFTPKIYSQVAHLRPGEKATKDFYNSVSQQMLNAIAKAEKNGGEFEGKGVELGENKIISVRNLLAGNKSTIKIVKNPDGSGVATVTLKDSSIPVPLSADEISKIPQLAVSNPFNDALLQIKSSDSNSTNLFPGGKDDPAYSYYSGMNFPRLVSSDMADRVKADIVGSSFNVYSDDEFTNNDFGNTVNKYALRIHYNMGNNKWITFDTSDDFLTLEDVYSDMKRLSPLMIEHYVNKYQSKN